MIAVQTRFRHCCFVIDKNVFDRFKEATAQDHVSMSKAIEQFLLSYVYCLDSGFVGSAEKNRAKSRREGYYVRLSADTYAAFVEKTAKEKADMNLIVEQFFIHYAAFMKAMRSPEKKRAI